MKSPFFSLLAFSAGILLAIQAGYNTQLSGLLRQPVLATISNGIFTVLFAAVFILLRGRQLPSPAVAGEVPWYLWGLGGLFSVLGISLYFYTIPKLGISRMIALGLCGQLLFSLVAGQLGWLNLPQEPITLKRLLGTAAMILGIFLINTK